jgi:hypothetical protein
LIVNIVRSIYKDPKKPDLPLTVAIDFMPKWNVDEEGQTEVKKQSVEEQKSILLSWVSAMKSRNARNKRKEKTDGSGKS